jgi:predicted aspartyl protease
LVIVRTEVWGPAGSAVLRLALDLGATATVINVAPMVAIGYDPALAPHRTQITTGSGIEFAPCITVGRLKALGRVRRRMPVLCHTLPASAGVDGLLGLDFVRRRRLTVDFRRARLTLV